MPAHLRQMMFHAYEILGDATPLKGNCGRLCDAACCKGDSDVGMLLFPGEAAYLAGVEGFRVTRIDYMGGKSWLLTCRDTCDRRLRPLACRIFPLAPSVDGSGRVRAVPDPRALPMCPLADCKSLDPRFRRRVDQVFQYLAGEPKMLELLTRISAEIDELQSLRSLFTGR